MSKGPAPISVPNVIGLTQAAASGLITGAGLTLGTVAQEFHATVPAGTVFAQNPAAGSSLPPGGAVALTVSKGPAPVEFVTVPNVTGQTQATAGTARVVFCTTAAFPNP
ncbi:MAG: PASTA domain-containing protein [Clostridia bacterium]|nr:PASTA domain-containing protein [Clostridia bacterium]